MIIHNTSMLRRFKNYIQSLSLNDQLYEVNEMIDYVNCSDIDDLKKIKMIIGLKQIRYTVLLSVKRKNLCTQSQCNKI